MNVPDDGRWPTTDRAIRRWRSRAAALLAVGILAAAASGPLGAGSLAMADDGSQERPGGAGAKPYAGEPHGDREQAGGPGDVREDGEEDTDPPRSRKGAVIRSVETQIDAGGEIVSAQVRERRRDAKTGARDESVEEIAEEHIPVALRVHYELDGERVTPDELRDASGQAVVRLQLRNPTVETRTVTLPDGEEVELELSLPMLAESQLDFDDSWQDVRSDGGRVAPTQDGHTQLRWSTALAEPIASSTAELEIQAEVSGARLPRLEVEATPVDAETSDLLRLLGQQATEKTTSDAVAAFVAEGLGEGLAGAAQGSGGLAQGLGQAQEGAQDFNAGLQEMQQEMAQGFDELAEGMTQLDAGLAGIAEALTQVENALREISQGLTAMGEGLGEARDGARTLRDEIAEPAEESVREVWAILTERFSVGRSDPAYPDVVEEVGQLYALLTGELPPTEALEDAGRETDLPEDGPPGERQTRRLDEFAEPLDLDGPETDDRDVDGDHDGHAELLREYPGLRQSLDELATGLDEAVQGVGRVAEVSATLSDGVGEIRAGIQQLREELDRAIPAPEGEGELEDLDAVMGEFEGGMSQLADGGQELAAGLEQLEAGGQTLLDQLDRQLDQASLDRAAIEALSKRAATSDDKQDGPVETHDRYLLIFEEDSRSPLPVAALGGLLALAAGLEGLRRLVLAP